MVVVGLVGCDSSRNCLVDYFCCEKVQLWLLEARIFSERGDETWADV